MANNSLQDFIDGLELEYTGEYQGDEYVITLDNDSDFSNLFTDISSDKQFSVEDGSISTRDNVMFTFYNDWFDLRFTGDFQKDIYRLTIGER